jgi:hypothetical protein
MNGQDVFVSRLKFTWSLPLAAGAYVVRPGGGMHVDRCKAGSECVLFTFQDGKADVLWPSR